ncbi:hypothetical protein BN134_3893 [Cronobacter dublinensis 1210]|uniref:Uncharacterized protein n=1 Tax=Cronobacter dublinensis 1210 TaxID=1208656 RepID=A0ABM9QC82_9ENTR|nr:hypothetical protein BN134_3893 [Cronobacter dublinensis 1210]
MRVLNRIFKYLSPWKIKVMLYFQKLTVITLFCAIEKGTFTIKGNKA